MGLHRDGQILGLSPFEIEMRRRVWWHIVLLDFRSAISSGFMPSSLPPVCDCRMPTNIKDEDFHPHITAYFQANSGPTEMIACLLLCNMAQCLSEQSCMGEMISSFEQNVVRGIASDQIGVAKLGQLGTDVDARLNAIIQKYCDPSAGVLHQTAFRLKSSVVDKLRRMSQLPQEEEKDGLKFVKAKDGLFRVSVDAVKHATDLYRSLGDGNPFLWFMLAHFEIDLFTYLVGELCHRSDGTLVESAWDLVPIVYHYHQDLYDLSSELHATLATLLLKAWSARQKALQDRNGGLLDTPEFIQRIEQDVHGLNDPAPTETIAQDSRLDLGNFWATDPMAWTYTTDEPQDDILDISLWMDFGEVGAPYLTGEPIGQI